MSGNRSDENEQQARKSHEILIKIDIKLRMRVKHELNKWRLKIDGNLNEELTIKHL